MVAYTLKLPEGSKVHPTFHVSLLKKCPDPSITPVQLPVNLSVSTRKRDPTKNCAKERKGINRGTNRWQGETLDDATWEVWHGFHYRFPIFSKRSHPWGQECSEGGTDRD